MLRGLLIWVCALKRAQENDKDKKISDFNETFIIMVTMQIFTAFAWKQGDEYGCLFKIYPQNVFNKIYPTCQQRLPQQKSIFKNNKQ